MTTPQAQPYAGPMARRRMTRAVLSVIAATIAVTSGAVTGSEAFAAPGPDAVGRWSMVPQSKDSDGDGVIDGDGGVPQSGALSLQPSARMVGAGNRVAQPHERLIDGALSWYLSDRGFAVRLNACSSSGDEARWLIEGAQAGSDGEIATTPWRPLARRTCSSTVRLPEGSYTAVLEVRQGRRRDRATLPITVDNIIVVSLGDSYASGEGNPRNVRAWLRQGGSFSPYWDDDGCRRSARGAPALAALALEKSSAQTSVTLIDVSCSGATVDAGVLGSQPSAGQSASQVEQAAALLRGRAADLVVISVGGNDVGFGSILEACALRANCPVSAPRAGPLAGSPTVQAGIQQQTAALAGDYARIAACLGGASCTLADGRAVPALPLAPGARVLPTLYPDITRAADGAPCSYLTIPPQDFAWARATILDPAPPPTYPYPLTSGGSAVLSVAAGSLNGQILASARLPGWVPVGGTWSASGDTPEGHGVCAEDQSWVFGFTGFSGLPSASFHPNPIGQDVLAAAITQAARAALAARSRTDRQ